MWFPNDEKIMDFSVLSSLFASFLLVGVENDDFCLRRGKNGEIFFWAPFLELWRRSCDIVFLFLSCMVVALLGAN